MPRILLIDDQKIPRMAVASILEEAGHEVAAAASGEKGLELARELSPDVIVLDVYMPGMDGFEVVEKLKADPETAPTPVIFLTAEPPTDDLIVRGLDLGAYDFLSKGCSRAELLARVGVMARIKRGNDELSAIARISDTLIQTLDPDRLSNRFVKQVCEVFRAEAALLAFVREAGAAPHVSTAGFEADPPLIESLSRSLSEELGRENSTQMEIGARNLRGPAGVLARREGYETALAARVEHPDRPATLLVVLSTRTEGFARQSDAPLLYLLARQATIALDHAVLHERTLSQAIEMEEQAEKLERAMTERSRFFASMSHELRTPINAVIGYNQLLELGAYGGLSEEQAEAVARVSRSAQHLLELINDILDISKIEAGKMEVSLEPTDLGELIADTITTVQIHAAEKGLDLEADCPGGIIIDTDPARLRQILLNLLSNAVKFTSEGRVQIKVTEREEWCDIEVVDTGPGIAPEDFARIFEEFEQTHRTPAGAGTGLGLPISKRLTHLLGGELEVRSELGVGSCFRLRLPRKRTPEAAISPAARAAHGDSA
jgi:signal transduction histidine kinase